MALGEILKQKRLARNWTREYVAERTHLMARVIEALESENYKKIPAPVYGRGFIRQYCALLELDPEPLLDEYAAAVCGGGRTSVTRPVVHDLPARPVEPIHTGGHKTLPPKDRELPTPVASVHKPVESAEDSFTAVPKPEIRPQATPAPPPPPPPSPTAQQPAASESEAFALDGGAVPPPPPPPPPRRTVVAPGRSALADLSKEVRAHDERGIFGPQHPVPDPISPQLRSLRNLWEGTIRLGSRLFAQLTRPKVRRMDGGQTEPLFSRGTLVRMVCVVGVLVALTVVVLAFRYVFRLSSGAETELSVSGAPTVFEPRPVADPPPPYFR